MDNRGRLGILDLVTPPAIEPISIDDVKKHSKIEIDSDDGLIQAKILGIRMMVERSCDLALITQTWTLSLWDFPSVIHIYKRPIQCINKIEYLVNGVLTTVSPSVYTADLKTRPPRIVPAYSQIWPTLDPAYYRPGAVVVTFKAGFSGNAKSIRSAAYKWTASGAGGAGVFYCELAAGGDPSIDEPASVRAGGTDLTLASAVGAIAAGGYWYGDGDTLGYNTVYVKLADSADPDGKAADYVTYFVDVPINVPEHIRQYLLFKVGDAYENRESYTTEERRPAVDFLDNLINSERLYGM